MQRVSQHDPPHDDFPWPPTEDQLPSSDGIPMETNRHVLQMILLMETLKQGWADRSDFFVGGNMFVYFSPDQVMNEDFRGPDVFVALGVSPRSRKSWVVWQEGKAPHVVIELLSDISAHRDRTEKKLVYQDKLRVPEYFWYDPWSGEQAGFALREGVYEPIEPDAEGRLASRVLDLSLVRWHGDFGREEATWLRWATADGLLLSTAAELAQQALSQVYQAERDRDRALAAAEQAVATAEQSRLDAQQTRRQIAELEARIARLERGDNL